MCGSKAVLMEYRTKDPSLTRPSVGSHSVLHPRHLIYGSSLMAQSTEGLHKSHNIWLKGKKFVSLILSTLVNKRKYEYNISIYPQFVRPLSIKLFKDLKCFKACNLIFICLGGGDHPARLHTFITSGLKVNYHHKNETSELAAPPAFAASKEVSLLCLWVGFTGRRKHRMEKHSVILPQVHFSLHCLN